MLIYVCMYVVSPPVHRVAVVDYDVHHGNGTEQCFWNDPDALFISIHQVFIYYIYSSKGTYIHTYIHTDIHLYIHCGFKSSMVLTHNGQMIKF